MGRPPGRRRIWKLWDEDGVGPTVVFEISSRGTWVEDFGNKKALCERLGVDEYFVIDPEREYLDPPVQGWRAVEGRFEPIEHDAEAALASDVLGVRVGLSESHITVRDSATGDELIRPDDEARARARAQAEADAERVRANQSAATAILTVLEARGFAVSDEIRAHVAREHDPATLRVLLERAATCAAASELLGVD